MPVNEDGDFLVLGAPLPSLDILPTPYVRMSQDSDQTHRVAMALGLADVTVQAARGLQAVQGLVRLAPETLAAIRAGSVPLAQGGWNLGALQQGGKILAQVRWAPIGAAGAVGVLSAVGPAVALLSAQWQLGTISRKVERNIALTTQVLDQLRNESWHELHGAADLVLRAVLEAHQIGEVNDAVWRHVESQAVLPVLTKQRSLHLEGLTQKARAFEKLSDDKKKVEWLNGNISEYLRDARGVLVSERAWLLYQELRAIHLCASADTTALRLANFVRSESKAVHRRAETLLVDSLDGLNRALSLWLEDDPRRTVGSGDQRLPLTAVREAVRALHQEAAEGPFGALPPLKVENPPEWRGKSYNVSSDESRSYGRRLWWLLELEEQGLMMTTAEVAFAGRKFRCLAVLTTQRLMFVDLKAMGKGVPDVQSLPLAGGFQVWRETQENGRERIDVRSGSSSGTLYVQERAQDVFAALKASSHNQPVVRGAGV